MQKLSKKDLRDGLVETLFMFNQNDEIDDNQRFDDIFQTLATLQMDAIQQYYQEKDRPAVAKACGHVFQKTLEANFPESKIIMLDDSIN